MKTSSHPRTLNPAFSSAVRTHSVTVTTLFRVVQLISKAGGETAACVRASLVVFVLKPSWNIQLGPDFLGNGICLTLTVPPCAAILHTAEAELTHVWLPRPSNYYNSGLCGFWGVLVVLVAMVAYRIFRILRAFASVLPLASICGLLRRKPSQRPKLPRNFGCLKVHADG